MFFFSSEILRAVDSLQLTEKKRVATPADWKVRDINIYPIYQQSLIYGLPAEVPDYSVWEDYFNYTTYMFVVISRLLLAHSVETNPS
jgi:hypothetical protein